MSTGELAPNPQNPNLLQTLQETAELINSLERPNGLEVHVPGAIYGVYRDRIYSKPEPGREYIQLAWANSGELLTSDGREVTSMTLDVPKDLNNVANHESVQTYRFRYVLDVTRRHETTITADNDQQQVKIVEDRPDNMPAHWLPMSEADTVYMLTVFHDALREAKPLDEEVTREIRENNELGEYIRKRWPNGFPHDNLPS